MKTLFAAFAIASFVLLCACAELRPPQSVSRNPLVQIAAINDAALFAANRSGRGLAVAKDGLQFLEVDSGFQRKLSPDTPVALSWSRDDAMLAAAFVLADYETRLSLYSAQGALLHETLLPVALTQMAWSARGDLLLAGYALKQYSFGGNLRQALYRVNGTELVETVLSDATLKPATAQRLASIMASILPVAFSPHGDEFVYLQLHDPPQFAPYLELFYRNWQASNSRSLQQIPLQRMQLAWHESAESVTVVTADGEQRFGLWPTAEAVEIPLVTGQYQFVDGRLNAGRELLVDWGKGARLQILADGRFLLAVHNALYLGDGLQAGAQENYNEKQWALRRWRFEGLISSAEYHQLLREGKP